MEKVLVIFCQNLWKINTEHFFKSSQYIMPYFTDFSWSVAY